MKLAFSSNAFKKRTLLQTIDCVAVCGYSGIEIMADVPHAFPLRMGDAEISTLREKLAQNNLAISNVNAFTFFAEGDTYHPSWIEEDSTLRERRLAQTKASIEMAGKLGAPSISIEPGGPLDTRDYALCWEIFVHGLREILPIAEAWQVKVLVEPEPNLLLENSDQIERLLREVNHPWLGFNCDLGHFFCVNEDPAEVILKLQPHIEHIHLEDIAATREHRHLVPGRGAMDFEKIFATLKKIDYRGFVTVELYPYESEAEDVAREAFAFLRRWF